jgi:hypothetical protein
MFIALPLPIFLPCILLFILQIFQNYGDSLLIHLYFDGRVWRLHNTGNQGDTRIVTKTTIGICGALLLLLILSACATTTPKPASEPRPLQNLIGSTDNLELVTELSLYQARQYGSEKLLVVMEIDQTLLKVPNGADSEDPCSPAFAGPVQAMHTDSATLLRRIQDAGIKVILMTSRSPDCWKKTSAQLHQAGFDPSLNSWPPGEYPDPLLLQGGAEPVRYADGVFFVDGQDKGDMLLALIEKSGLPLPILILMVDNQQKNLNSVMKAFFDQTTKTHLWLYTRQDMP